jgi:hypothetical protein
MHPVTGSWSLLSGVITITLIAKPSPARAADHLFVVEYPPTLVVLDPDTGDVVESQSISGSPRMLDVAFDGWTLFGVDELWTGHPDRWFRIHPADARATPGNPTGYSWGSNYAIEWDPSNGWFWAVYDRDVFRVAPGTGTTTYHGTLVGLTTYDSIAALARDDTGTFIAVGWSTVFSGSQGIAVYEIDFGSLAATWLGGIPGANYHYYDVAFAANGTLWAVAEEFGVGYPPWRLCRIDLVTKTRTVVRVPPLAYGGIASVPDMQGTAFCQPKLGSLGCAPTCSWSGLGSPTASSGFDIRVNDVISGTWGSLYYGIGQQAALPFGGGTLCIRGSLRKAGPVWSGGSPWATCDGVWSVDFNEWMATHVAIPAGTTVRAQWLGRDPGFAPPANWQMSNALEFVLRP